jgi:hypothetical protein
MLFEFDGQLISWRGPSPYYFIAVPEEPSAALESASLTLSYGWGCIPVAARIGGTTWSTSLFPKDGLYLLPVKAAVRKAEGLDLGDEANVRLDVAM